MRSPFFAVALPSGAWQDPPSDLGGFPGKQTQESCHCDGKDLKRADTTAEHIYPRAGADNKGNSPLSSPSNEAPEEKSVWPLRQKHFKSTRGFEHKYGLASCSSTFEKQQDHTLKPKNTSSLKVRIPNLGLEFAVHLLKPKHCAGERSRR